MGWSTQLASGGETPGRDQARPYRHRYEKVVDLVSRLADIGREMARYPAPERDASGRMVASPRLAILMEQERDVIDRLALRGMVFTERFGQTLTPLARQDQGTGGLDGDHRGVIEDQAARLAELSEALLARTDIGRAQGIIMAELHLSAKEAAATLAKASHQAGESAHHMARGIIAQAEEASDSTKSQTPATNTPPRSRPEPAQPLRSIAL